MIKKTISSIVNKVVIKKERYRMKNSKIGVTYSIFNGEEMLPYSIRCIRDNVDYINVVYQKKSWTGKDCSKSLFSELCKMKNDGLIDKIIEYKLPEKLPLDKFSLVIKKKKLGINDLKKNKCTHILILDADELFIPKEFKAAKEYIIRNNITHSAMSIYDYKYFPEIRNRDISRYAVPFIFKLRFYSRLTNRHHMPCLVDDLRAVKFNRLFDRFYYFNTLFMHHMTGIRKNYEKKLESSINNYSDVGKNYLKEVKSIDEKERKLNIDELLVISNNDGGYIRVENTFNIDCCGVE